MPQDRIIATGLGIGLALMALLALNGQENNAAWQDGASSIVGTAHEVTDQKNWISFKLIGKNGAYNIFYRKQKNTQNILENSLIEVWGKLEPNEKTIYATEVKKID